jgi:IclR family acetate operon transcriptional repressor
MKYTSPKPFEPTAVKSASRAVDIVELVARSGPASARDIARQTNIPVSSLSYLLATLVDRDWLHLAGNRTYAIGAALSRLAEGAKPTRAERLRRLVVDVGKATGETASLFARRGFEIEATDVALSRHPLRFAPERGIRVPLHSFAAGKSILAVLDDATFETYLAKSERTRFTTSTIVDADLMRREVEAIRARGYAVSREEHAIGVVGIGLAIDQDLSISIAIPTPRFNEDAEKASAKALIEAVGSL